MNCGKKSFWDVEEGKQPFETPTVIQDSRSLKLLVNAPVESLQFPKIVATMQTYFPAYFSHFNKIALIDFNVVIWAQSVSNTICK